MSGFSSMFGMARALHQGVRGQSVQFQPANTSSPVETVRPVSIGEVTVQLGEGEAEQTKLQRRTLEVPTLVAEGGPSELIRGGKYTIDGEEWTVELALSVGSETKVARLMLMRPLRLESGGRGERAARQLAK